MSAIGVVLAAACAPDALRFGGSAASAGAGTAVGGAGGNAAAGAAGTSAATLSGPLPPARSCAGDLRCADGSSCCASIDVPASDVLFGRSDDGADAAPVSPHIGAPEQPEQRSTVSAFTLDTFEVTVGRFRNWVERYDGRPPAEGAGAHPRIPDTGWRPDWDKRLPSTKEELAMRVACDPVAGTWTAERGANENKPITCVTWYEAMAFCIWDGGRLATAREWERVAANGEENRLFPWGTRDAGLDRANYNCAADGLPGCAAADILAVGSLPGGNGALGHRDLAGNVREWVLDSGFGTAPCVDCITASALDLRVLRGGSWAGEGEFIRSAATATAGPAGRGETTGIRCARTPVKRSCASNPRCGGGGASAGGQDCCESLIVPGGSLALGRSEEGADACVDGGCLSNELPERPRR